MISPRAQRRFNHIRAAHPEGWKPDRDDILVQAELLALLIVHGGVPNMVENMEAVLARMGETINEICSASIEAAIRQHGGRN